MIAEAEPHVSAVLSMARSRVPAGLAVELGVGPAGTSRYAVLYPDPGDVFDARLCGDRSVIVIHFMLHAVGEGPEQALWVSDKMRLALLGDPPTVPGRKVRRMTQSLGAQPLRRDDKVQPPMYYQVSEYRLMSQAAA